MGSVQQTQSTFRDLKTKSGLNYVKYLVKHFTIYYSIKGFMWCCVFNEFFTKLALSEAWKLPQFLCIFSFELHGISTWNSQGFQIHKFHDVFWKWMEIYTNIRASSTKCTYCAKMSTKKFLVLLNKETKLHIFLFVKAKHKAYFYLFRSTQMSLNCNERFTKCENKYKEIKVNYVYKA